MPLRLAVGGVFLWSGLSKVLQPYDFLSNVYAYELVGPATGLFLANWLPWLELVLGVCLIFGLFETGSFLVSAVLLGVFVGVKWWAAAKEMPIPCGCGLIDKEQISQREVVATASLLALTTVALILSATRAHQPSPGHVSDNPPVP